MRLRFSDWGINVAVGWTGTWRVDVLRTGDAVTLRAGQAAFASYLKPGETVRTPRMTYEAYTGGEDRARNLWRSFYLAHILPRENGDLRKKLHAIAHGPRVAVAYESPHRIVNLVEQIAREIPGARVCVCCDLTK